MEKIKFGLNKKAVEKLERLSKGGKIYTAGSSYSGGWKKAFDETDEYINILNTLNKKYSIGNDAPRSGLNGKYILCRKFDFEKLKEN